VVGLDDDGERAVRPILLVGVSGDGREEEVALLGPDLIRQSAVLTGARWSDATEARIVIDVRPGLLQLLVRFGKLVQQHNAIGASKVKLPVAELPPALLAKNRGTHLPHVIGNSSVLAEFLDILGGSPYLVYLCAQAAERLLWEPAMTAFLLKFGICIHGLSLPQVELIWPLDPRDETDTAVDLRVALTQTNKFFELGSATDQDKRAALAPPTPAAHNGVRARRVRKAPANPAPSSTFKAPKRPPCPATMMEGCTATTSLDRALWALRRWHDF
jgi:hypothetical protein